MEFHRVLVQDVVDFLPHLFHGEGSALGVRGQGAGARVHLEGNSQERHGKMQKRFRENVSSRTRRGFYTCGLELLRSWKLA